jgi:ubiquinone/menaquinone biosynthesis C-methylase UbiE
VRGLEQIPWLYDSLMAVCEVAGFDRWRRWLVGGATGQVLDLGCGTGRSLPLAPAAARVVGLDSVLASLRKARRRAPGVPLVCARAEALPFRAGAFDRVIASLVLCSVSDPRGSLAELRRVLAPRGRARLIEHVRSRWRAGARVQDLVQPAWTRLSGGCHPNRDTEASLEAAGFVLEEREVRGLLRRLVARPAPPPGVRR